MAEVTDYNDKQADFEDIHLTSNPPEKQSVTYVTNTTDSGDAKATDKLGADENIKSNSNNIDIISNSYNKRSNNLSIVTSYSNTNTPSSSSGCVTSVTPLPSNSLDGLSTLSCLFCSSYKTKIRFDMELHLFEKHKQNLIYDLTISGSKATIDDRIEYTLQLIEQGKIILPNDPNDDRWSAD